MLLCFWILCTQDRGTKVVFVFSDRGDAYTILTEITTCKAVWSKYSWERAEAKRFLIESCR